MFGKSIVHTETKSKNEFVLRNDYALRNDRLCRNKKEIML